MAWIVGLASPEEIAAILKAGYEIHTHNVMPEIGYDVQDLLDMKGE
jgi:alpha-acetolactate decarboxylase